jgi:hypothetical protein
MTFDKYDGIHNNNPYATTVFPDDGYEYDYIWNKEMGWHQVRGKLLSDLPKQE